MTIHKSLLPPDRFKGKRNVLSRVERIGRLKKEGRWKEGDSVFGISKVKVVRLKARKKKEEKPAEEAPTAAAEGGADKEKKPEGKGK